MLRADQLADLAATLTHHGYAVSVHQTLAAARLLAKPSTPAAIDELAPWLAPIFCCNAQQQLDFTQIYLRWAQNSSPGSNAVPFALLEDKDLNTFKRTENFKLPLRWHQRMQEKYRAQPAKVFLYILLAGIIAALSGTRIGTLQDAPIAPAPNDNAAAANPIQKTVTSPKSIGTGPSSRPERSELTPAVAMPIVVTSAGIIFLCWLILVSRRRGFLERHPSQRDHTELHLRTAQSPALESWRGDVSALGRSLRRRVTRETPELDAAATVDHYCRNGILSKLFFGSRSEPEYLILIDRVSRYDHFAKLADELVHALHHDSGVNVDAFVFKSDPRKLRKQSLDGKRGGRDSMLNLEGLYGRHPQARLLVFSDGDSLISPLTGRAVEWLSDLLQWSHMALITPRAQPYWSVKEYLLRKAGIDVLPLDCVGLSELAKALTVQHGEMRQMPFENPREIPRHFRDVAVLLDSMPPAESDVAQLLVSLRVDLGHQGYTWLCACAVYPEIHWGITLALGRELLATHPSADKTFADLLIKISSLPWMRWGHMPEWLREHFVNSLSTRDEVTTRMVLESYLARLTSERDEVTAEALRVDLLQNQRFLQDVWHGLIAMVRSPQSPKIREDRVYLRFMSGNPSRLAVAVGDRFAQMFYQHGARLAKPRPLPFILAFLVASCVAWLLPGEAPKVGVREENRADSAEKYTPPLPPPTDVSSVASSNLHRSNTDKAAASPVQSLPAPASQRQSSTSQPVTDSAVVNPTASIDSTRSPSEPAEADAGGAEPYAIRVTAELTGGKTSTGLEQRMRFWLVAEPERLEKIRNVVYFMDNPSFSQKNYPSSDASSGFEQTYIGDCATDVVVTINLKAGGSTRQRLDMCSVADGIPPTESQKKLF